MTFQPLFWCSKNSTRTLWNCRATGTDEITCLQFLQHQLGVRLVRPFLQIYDTMHIYMHIISYIIINTYRLCIYHAIGNTSDHPQMQYIICPNFLIPLIPVLSTFCLSLALQVRVQNWYTSADVAACKKPGSSKEHPQVTGVICIGCSYPMGREYIMMFETKNPTEKTRIYKLQIATYYTVNTFLCQFYRRKQEPLPWIWLLDTVSLDRCTPIKSVHLSRKIGPNHTPFLKQRCLKRDCHGVFMCIVHIISSFRIYHLWSESALEREDREERESLPDEFEQAFRNLLRNSFQMVSWSGKGLLPWLCFCRCWSVTVGSYRCCIYASSDPPVCLAGRGIAINLWSTTIFSLTSQVSLEVLAHTRTRKSPSNFVYTKWWRSHFGLVTFRPTFHQSRPFHPPFLTREKVVAG